MIEGVTTRPGRSPGGDTRRNPKNRAKWVGCSRVAAAAFRPGEAKWEPRPALISATSFGSGHLYEGVAPKTDPVRFRRCSNFRQPRAGACSANAHGRREAGHAVHPSSGAIAREALVRPTP